MPAAAVTRVVTQREATDCGIAALAMLLGATYEDVLRAATIADRRQGREGLWGRTMIRIAARLGHTLKVRRKVDVEADFGILRLPDHAAVLRNGLIIDTDGSIWDADIYLAHKGIGADECELLMVVE